MERTMKEKEVIREELMELMNEYYHGSFAQMVCDYIRCTGMTPQEVKGLLEAIKFICCIHSCRHGVTD